MKALAIALLMISSTVTWAAPLQAGETAPCVTLPQVDKDGNKSTQSTCASQASGKKIVLEFFATWCGYCKQNLPVFESIAAKLQDKADFRVVGIDETTEPLEQYFAGRTMDGYSLAFDPQFSSVEAFGIEGTPSIYVIGTDGKIVLFHEGTMETPEEIQQVEDAIAN
ncbi:MAG: TlpA family protein disulfide reductase [Bdellovibrionales bacterium]